MARALEQFAVFYLFFHTCSGFLSVPRTPNVIAPHRRSSSRAASGLSMAGDISIGIVGATGAVGEELLKVMETRNFPCSSIKLFASEKSAGKVVDSPKYGKLTMETFSFEEASKLTAILLAVGGDFSLEWAEKLAAAGVLVIDNSSAFRYKDDVPLVIPEINIEAAKAKKAKLIANPNCTTAIALVALWPIHQKFKIKKAIMSTYQAASGAGNPGMQELKDGMAAIVAGGKAENKIFAYPLPYNVIPHIDVFQENMYTKEEMKVTWETRKIMNDPEMKVSCTAVRIPTLRAHSEAITLETEQKITAKEVQELMKSTPGVKLVDEPLKGLYPMPMNAANQYDVEVGRIRNSEVFGEYGIDLFLSGDQLLRGAALNAVIIAEKMVA
mmetsp:Transcript_37486/g.38174  ORF Transcript_37486/g.38174 Transcript_37486/m.38174 type:complete len:384 (-) Transcript_37486:108-1259(-)|eukprot:CAMPEP_0182419582 /NCGR_PEP_ID=MMETSP1167-20130531/4002_1 /TAXON_ID=2988 /ORGANISM="Mallomonas Sp, Strain CCMP3275" /LENGTH=383 /DNA_ID=CAMNT_0024594575 /DNA_START=106 /DNA_END=1257 /DNA_ORIENTATION=-